MGSERAKGVGDSLPKRTGAAPRGRVDADGASTPPRNCAGGVGFPVGIAGDRTAVQVCTAREGGDV